MPNERTRGLNRINQAINDWYMHHGSLPNLMLFRNPTNALIVFCEDSVWTGIPLQLTPDTLSLWSEREFVVCNTTGNLAAHASSLPHYQSTSVEDVINNLVTESFVDTLLWNKQIAPPLKEAFKDKAAVRELSATLGAYHGKN